MTPRPSKRTQTNTAHLQMNQNTKSLCQLAGRSLNHHSAGLGLGRLVVVAVVSQLPHQVTGLGLPHQVAGH